MGAITVFGMLSSKFPTKILKVLIFKTICLLWCTSSNHGHWLHE